jgi:hypothetical protein
MTIVEKPLKTHKSVPSLRDLANTQDAQWVRVSKYSPSLDSRVLLKSVSTVEDAVWRKPTALENAMRPISDFFRW